jgi:ribose transport system substrate-binding protein
VDFRVTDAGGAPAVQALHIDQLVRQGVDVLITSPAEARRLDPALRAAYDAEVPVILLDRRTGATGYASFVHPDNRRITQRLARDLFDRMEGSGRVLMLKGVPGATPTRHRTRTFLAMAEGHPGIEVVSRTANYLRGDAILAVDRLLRRTDGFPFDAIYAQSDSMAVGARIALRRNGIDPGGVIIAGIDYIRQARAAIRRGEQDVSFTYPTGGQEGARLALRLLKGEAVPEEVVLESRRVTPHNVDIVPPIF